MKLISMSASMYRSLRRIRLDIGQTSLFVGENGVGKSNLYRALRLISAAATGTLAFEIASEAGMASALWTGKRRAGAPVRIRLEVELLDEQTALSYRYHVEAGIRPPTAAGFAFEPQIKQEELAIGTGRRWSVTMKREAVGVSARGDDGRMAEWPEPLLTSETALAALGQSGRFAEIALVRQTLANWRFYHGFRSDDASPLRYPCLAVTAPLLREDGANLAAVFATLRHIRQDTIDLDRAVSDAFSGAYLDVPEPGDTATFGLVLPEFPQRVFGQKELSDGQIRFLALAGALLSYRQPPFIALNEPEASLHPAMLPALAMMIERAALSSQVWVVTHSQALAGEIAARCGVRAHNVIREAGATWIEGMSLSGDFRDEDD